jgi:hypothetical protein
MSVYYPRDAKLGEIMAYMSNMLEDHKRQMEEIQTTHSEHIVQLLEIQREEKKNLFAMIGFCFIFLFIIIIILLCKVLREPRKNRMEYSNGQLLQLGEERKDQGRRKLQ